METLKICLCCLLPADKDLKTPYSRGQQVYADMLEECFQIHLTLGGECGICEVCVRRLRDASDFKLQVQRSQAELQRLLGALQVKDEELVDEPEIPCEDDGDVFQRDPLVKSEMDDVKINENLKTGSVGPDSAPIPSCDHLNARRFLIDHDYAKTDTHSVQGETDIELPLCMCDAHGQSLPILPVPSARPVSARAREQLAAACSVRLERLRGEARGSQKCLRTSRREARASQTCLATSRREARASQTCLATSRRGPRRARLKDSPHDTAGVRGKVYECDTCGKKFTDKCRLIKHTQGHATRAAKLVIAYVCACTRRFSSKTAFFKHKLECWKPSSKSVAIKKPYTGEIRRRMHTTNCDLKHDDSTESKIFICDICGTQLASINSLTIHIKDIHKYPRKLYRCEVCYKRFTYKSFLNHKNAHIERPYNCEECNQNFKSRTTLRLHIQIHTGEKPYVCDECGKQFRQRSAFDCHKKIHSGIKPYCCEVCNKRFVLKCHWIRHRIIHTGKKPYRCEVCNRKFTFQSTLIQHKKRKHRKQ